MREATMECELLAETELLGRGHLILFERCVVTVGLESIRIRMVSLASQADAVSWHGRLRMKSP